MAATNMSTDRLDELEHEKIEDGVEKQTRRPSQKDSESSLGQDNLHINPRDQEIQWLYLEFETELPQPSYISNPEERRASRTQPADPPDLKDFESPFLWSAKRKSIMTWLSCIVTMFVAYNAGAYTSGLDQMMAEWNVSRVTALVGVTVFTIGFAIAPMFLAPFSEINGRRPVFVVTGLGWIVFQIVCGVTPTFAGMVVNRFLSGCASSTFSTMVGGVVSDIYHAKDRNTAMTLFTAAAMTGTGLGPLVSGFIAQHTTWRWIFYLQVIIDGLLMVLIVFFFKETRGSVLLSRKAKKLNKYYDALEAAGYYGVIVNPSTTASLTSSSEKPTSTLPQRVRWKVLADEERTSVVTMIRISLHRPFHMLFTEPVVFFFSLWISFSWAVLYMTFAAVPLIFQTTYGFNLQETGAVFSSICIASILFTVVAIKQEDWVKPHLPESQRRVFDTPEGRLWFACVESAALPVGSIWFAVSGAYPGVHWIVPALGVSCATIGIFSIYLAVFNYLADSYHRYASSALAAQSFCRNMLAGAFPLFTTQMFNKMTFQGAGGLLGGIGFLLTMVPWVLFLYGPKIRAKSRLASEIMTKA
ncbi:putative major facilitator superfamily, MFS transporter superfamily [Septoria linicola]|nr:putative major facilitator superfamily, MFS transporter superfamily [Septoria linicola]